MLLQTLPVLPITVTRITMALKPIFLLSRHLRIKSKIILIKLIVIIILITIIMIKINYSPLLIISLTYKDHNLLNRISKETKILKTKLQILSHQILNLKIRISKMKKLIINIKVKYQHPMIYPKV